MTEKQLRNYLETGDEIEFEYGGKKYYIGPGYDCGYDGEVSFYEFYHDCQNFPTYEEFSQNATIDGKRVVEILYDIDDADVW